MVGAAGPGCPADLPGLPNAGGEDNGGNARGIGAPGGASGVGAIATEGDACGAALGGGNGTAVMVPAGARPGSDGGRGAGAGRFVDIGGGGTNVVGGNGVGAGNLSGISGASIEPFGGPGGASEVCAVAVRMIGDAASRARMSNSGRIGGLQNVSQRGGRRWTHVKARARYRIGELLASRDDDVPSQ
jgi:hypothetical protein